MPHHPRGSRYTGAPITQRNARRYLIGRTITAVSVAGTMDTSGGRVHNVQRIELDDGTRLVLSVAELPADYAVTFTRYSADRDAPLPGEGVG